jgi:MoxR-like ATPase
MAKIKDIHEQLKAVQLEIQKAVMGQQGVTNQILIALLTNSHALLESVPGLGKTTLVKSVADVLALEFTRVQNTPDLMPSDITGTVMVFDRGGKQVMEFQHGPIFTNILLADEINRATPKTQAAMLEAMAEKQVTVSGETYKLEPPFFVLATQNPIDQEGTYPLPEAQTDRFLLKILVDYPKHDEELEIVEKYGAEEKNHPKVSPMLDREDVLHLQALTRQMPISRELLGQCVELIQKTRVHKDIKIGGSPRASIGIVLAAKAHAMLTGKNLVTREDVAAVAKPVLRHRIILTFSAEQEGKTVEKVIEDLVRDIIKSKQ